MDILNQAASSWQKRRHGLGALYAHSRGLGHAVISSKVTPMRFFYIAQKRIESGFKPYFAAQGEHPYLFDRVAAELVMGVYYESTEYSLLILGKDVTVKHVRTGTQHVAIAFDDATHKYYPLQPFRHDPARPTEEWVEITTPIGKRNSPACFQGAYTAFIKELDQLEVLGWQVVNCGDEAWDDLMRELLPKAAANTSSGLQEI